MSNNKRLNTIVDESLTDIDASLILIRDELKEISETLSNSIITVDYKTKFLLEVVPHFVFNKGLETNEAIKEALRLYEDIIRYKSFED